MIGGTQQNDTTCSIPCNLCGSTDVEELALRDRNGNYLRTVICKICGSIWTDPRPKGEDIEKFYSKEYRLEYKGIHRPKPKHIYREVIGALRRFDFMKEVIRKNDLILDIGSGSGVFVYTLRKLGYDASGIEPDQGYAGYAAEVLQVPVKVAFVQDIDTSDSVNIVTMHHVLEHLEDPYGAVCKVHSLLKDKGFLIIDVPNAENIRQDPHNRYHKAHLYTFNPETIECLGSKAGFNVHKISVEPYNGNISAIFQQSDVPGTVDGKLPGNYDKITKILDAHTTLRHFTTLTPYKKFLANTIKAIQEQMIARKFGSAKDIIDSIVREKNNKLTPESEAQ
ncbi:MAG: methyltransferase domain-containing protein [Phycisphaerales bacterium]|nr:MAG: methyltransferase domain-containing protein [Phycisphaerales bacterium]